MKYPLSFLRNISIIVFKWVVTKYEEELRIPCYLLIKKLRSLVFLFGDIHITYLIIIEPKSQ